VIKCLDQKKRATIAQNISRTPDGLFISKKVIENDVIIGEIVGETMHSIITDIEEMNEEMVNTDVEGFRFVCEEICDCSEENIFGLNDAVELENLCIECDTAVSHMVGNWRREGTNSNVRGAGTGRATFFRKEKKTESTGN
jgi:hypothetical protein